SAAALLVVAALALVALVGEDVVSWEGPMLLGAPLLLVVGWLVWARADGAAPIRLWPAIGLFLVGSVLPTVPWLVWLARRLGPRFVQEVFLVGSGAERVYGISYPVEITFPAAGPLLAGLVIVAVGALGLAVESGLVRRRRALAATAAMAIAFVALGRLFFRMPEGLGAAIVMQVLHIPFYAAPPLALGTAAFVLHRGRASAASLGPNDQWLVVALVFAVSMYLMLYPRIDTMHLVFALPSVLVLAAAATARSARAWAAVLGVPAHALRAGAAGVAAVLIVV